MELLFVIFPLSSDSDASYWLLAWGFIAGTGFYGFMYRKYRNADKSHDFENETLVEVLGVKESEHKIDEIRKTKKKKIDGDNYNSHRQRVKRIQISKD